MQQSDLFSSSFQTPEEIIRRDGLELSLFRQWLSPDQANQLFCQLHERVAWHQSIIQMYGRTLKIPRLNAWYGDKGCDYSYSGVQLTRHDWLPELLRIRESIADRLSIACNAVLVNLYRDGADSVDWHADDEPELGPEPVVVSLSLGAERLFRLKPKSPAKAEPVDILLPSGSLLVMKPPTQRHWLHAIPKTRRPVSPRINLTFRQRNPVM